MDSTLRRTWAEIDMDALAHNYETLRKRIGENVKFLGVVKADAYGHGSVQVSRLLQESGADYLAVSSIDEAVELRHNGITMPVLILGHTPKEEVSELIKNNITQAVTCRAKALEYSEEAVKKERCRCAELNSLMRISCAMDALSERCTLEESIGRISVEFAYLYPPGIPLVVPGEQITGLLIKNMKRYLEQGLEFQGLSDMSDSTILVLARDTREIVPKKSEGKVKIQE